MNRKISLRDLRKLLWDPLHLITLLTIKIKYIHKNKWKTTINLVKIHSMKYNRIKCIIIETIHIVDFIIFYLYFYIYFSYNNHFFIYFPAILFFFHIFLLFLLYILLLFIFKFVLLLIALCFFLLLDFLFFQIRLLIIIIGFFIKLVY